MLIMGTVGLLFKPSVGNQTVDPAMGFVGANISNLLMHLLTIWYCCRIVVTLNRDWPPRTLYCWRALCLVAATMTLVAYPFSDQFRIEADEFELGDTGSLLQYWVVTLIIVAAFAIVAITAVVNISRCGPDLTITMGFILLFGLAGSSMGTATLTLLVVDPGWLHQNYRGYATPSATIGLILLAASGVPGLIEAWLRRNNPR
jgi:hypothetical protein